MGGISTIGAISGIIYTVYLVIKGVFPVWYRLGVGLSQRKIAIFAEEEFETLKNMLVDSKLFNAKNVIKIDKGSVEKANNIKLLLVHYKPFQESINEIINIKKSSDALIIYAPQDEGRIDQEVLNTISLKQNSIIVNLRGRLLNDILISMITTGYESA
jgi:hypothetical protein